LYILLIFVMNFLCVPPRVPAMRINIGSTFQPLVEKTDILEFGKSWLGPTS
jgi:hypothetical protein